MEKNLAQNPFKTWWKARKVFKRPHLKVYFGPWRIGLPVWRENITPIIGWWIIDIIWKDKHENPVHEYSPQINIIFFKCFQLFITTVEDEDYWEQLLWYLHYTPSKKISDAKKTWGWTNFDTKESTWKDKYLTKDARREVDL